jgi:Raf kinase inhibitor-like YbhB/YbcL family protein
MRDLEVSLGFGQVPAEHTCDGRNTSPRIEIKGLEARSLALVVEDPDAPLGTFIHWVIWNLEPAEVLPEGIPKDRVVARPVRAIQGTNSFGRIGYDGPCPPRGRPHRYIFNVYGLDSMLELKPGSSRDALERAMSGHILQQGKAVATYGR